MPPPENLEPKPPEFLHRSDLATALGVTLPKLTYFFYALDRRRRYSTFEIHSKSGRSRVIRAPIPPIKKIQQELLKLLTPSYIPRTHVHGYVNHRSPLSNADVHKYQRWVLHVDIRHFFSSITTKRLTGLFRKFPFFYSRPVAELLSRICTHYGVLPQGAPTSPLLSNLICRRLDRRLAQLAIANRCLYSRYCDDITFSTGRKSFPPNLALHDPATQQVTVGPDLEFVIESEGFSLREDKTSLRNRTEHQMVTGLTVNQFANVPRKYVRSLRNLLFIWRTYGEAAAQSSFDKLWQPNRPPRKAIPSLKVIVRGRIQYVGMVKGWFDPVYRRLAASFAEIDDTYVPTDKHSDRPKTVIMVHCEGKSDVKHLWAAWNYFMKDYPQLDPRFVDAGSDTELLKRMQTLSSINQTVPSVGIFDRDNPSIMKQVQGADGGFKRWARGVYSFFLPTPPHRSADDQLCIELMHTDVTLALEDSNGRRVFRKSEFKENGFHKDGHAVMMKSGGSSLVVSEARHTTTQDNIALGKDKFAELIAKKKAPFSNVDLAGFKVIFDALCDVRQRWLADRIEPF